MIRVRVVVAKNSSNAACVIRDDSIMGDVTPKMEMHIMTKSQLIIQLAQQLKLQPPA